MPVKNIKTLIYGNNIASLVCGEQLLAAGEEVLVLSPNAFFGGHFGGIDINNVHYDIGMNFLEFTSYRAEPSASVKSYNQTIKNDSGRFVGRIRSYVEENLGVATVRVETPEMYLGGRWYEDFIISDRLGSLAKLPPTLRGKLAKDIQNLEPPEALHARNKNTSTAFLRASLEEISRANHGDVFHETFIEPLCRKIINLSSSRIMAYYHRLAWLPIFYPETLKACFSGNPQPLPNVHFNYPESGQSVDPITILIGRLREKNALKISPIAFRGIKFSEPTVVTLENGDEIYAENFIWGNDWAKLSRITGDDSPQPFDMANITCVFFEIDAGHLQRTFSTAFIVDGTTPCYRITQFDSCAGKTSGSSRICMEFNTDNLENTNSLEEFWKTLVDLGVVKKEASAYNGQVKHFQRALLLATPKNYQLYSDLEKSFTDKNPAISSMTGVGGFSSTSFNDQVIQGMKAAVSILEG